APHRPVPLLLRRRGRPRPGRDPLPAGALPALPRRRPGRRREGRGERSVGRPSRVMAGPGPSAVFDLVGTGAGAGWFFDTTCDRLAPGAAPWRGSCAAAAGP